MRTPFSESIGTLFAQCLSKSGTSEGAKKAWEVRRRAKEEDPKDRPVKTPKVAATMADAQRLVSERISGVPVLSLVDDRPIGQRVDLAKHFARLTAQSGPTPESFTKINPVVDTVVKNLGEACAEITRKKGTELGFIVENETGSLVGKVVEGDKTCVDFSAVIQHLDPNKGYTHFHTHPGGSTFSSMDLASISAIPQMVRGVVYGVVGKKTEVYEISKPAGCSPIDPAGVRNFTQKQYYRALGISLYDRMALSEMTKEEKNKAKEISVKAAASGFGLNYRSSEEPVEQKA